MFSSYYNTNGIPSEKPDENSFWVKETNIAEFLLKEGDCTYDIEATCIQLRDRLAIKMFGDLSTYHDLLPTIPMPYFYGGIDAEVNVSKEEFEKFATTMLHDPMHNQLLYFYDVSNLISTLQNSVLESKHLLGLFYKTLNLNSFLVDPNTLMVEEGLQYAAGAIVTNITSTVNHLFINLHSQLDFITKIAYEFERLATNFTSYPKLASRDKVFGDAKKLSLNALAGTIYEESITIKRIIALRNEIVHNSSIDSMPKVYQVIKDNKIVEKYILLPDLENGFIKSFKNRRRFFNQDVKLNYLLPEIMKDFWERILRTVSAIK